MRSPAAMPIKILIMIVSLAIAPAVSFAQGAGGASGSSTGAAKSPALGTNSLGTAQPSGANTARGQTTGSVTGANPDADATVNAENRLLEKKLKSICRGC